MSSVSHPRAHSLSRSQLNDYVILNLSSAATTVATPYDCCIAAITYQDSNTSVWAFDSSNNGACFVGKTGNSCPDLEDNLSVVITNATGTLVVGNAYCGGVGAAIPLAALSSAAP